MSTIVKFAGEYDISVMRKLRAELDVLAAHPNVVLDFIEVEYIDSTCLTELIRAQNSRRRSGFERLTIVLPKGNPVRRLFEIVGIDDVFNIVGSFEASDEVGESVLRAFPGIARDEGPLESGCSEAENVEPV